MAYKALDIAYYVIEYCNDKKFEISNLKLQKILFYIQAAFLVEAGVPAFEDEISAWKYGPVVEEVYHEFKVYADDNIDLSRVYVEYSPIDSDDKERMNKVIDSYKSYTPIDIMIKTHTEEPWLQFKSSRGFIDKAVIKKYYMENKSKLYGRNKE